MKIKKILLIIIMTLTMQSFVSLIQVVHAEDRSNFQLNTERDNEIVDIAAGDEHSLLLRRDGTVLGMGNNGNGPLGLDLHGWNNSIPGVIRNNSTILKDIVGMAAGEGYSAVLKNDGTVWEFGSGSNTYLDYEYNIPTKVNGIDNTVKIVCGYGFNYAIKSDGTLWTWLRYKETGFKIENIQDVIDISSNKNHTIILKSDGTVWQWEYNSYRDNFLEFDPKQIMLEDGFTPLSDVVKIATRNEGWSFAMKSDGTVWQWQNYHTISKNEDKPVKQMVGVDNVGYMEKAIDISCGPNSTMVVMEDGKVALKKDTLFINGGVPRYIKKNSSEPISGVKKVSMRNQHALFLLEDGTVLALGNNEYGQLGNSESETNELNYHVKVMVEKCDEIEEKYKNYTIWDGSMYLLKNNWRIKFNKEIDNSCVNESSIYLTNILDEKVPVLINIEDENTIYIRFRDLTQDEMSRNVYFLVVTDEIRSKEGDILLNPLRKRLSAPFVDFWSN